MKVFVSAGEVSGDQALAAVLAALKPELPGLRLAGLGGEASAAQGLDPLVPLERTAVSGVGDVLARLFPLARARRAAIGALEASGESRPDLALLVDYPGLNLELARRARARGIPVYYIAPPQAWIYKDPRAKAEKASRSLRGARVHVLFPFERDTFAAAASKVVTGHFLGEAMAAGEAREAATRGVGASMALSSGAARSMLALCPGSRLPAVRRNLPAWLRALRSGGVIGPRGPVPGGPERIAVFVPTHLAEHARSLAPSAEIVTDKGRILRESTWAFAFPGTMTLELALARVPAAVVAALDPLTLALGRKVVKGPWLGLPNLLLGREAFPEWVGRPPTLDGGVAAALWKRLRDHGPEAAREAGSRLSALLGPATGASTAASECLKILTKG